VEGAILTDTVTVTSADGTSQAITITIVGATLRRPLPDHLGHYAGLRRERDRWRDNANLRDRQRNRRSQQHCRHLQRRDADCTVTAKRQRGLEPRQRGSREGANSFTAKATDAVGNTGVASAIFVATRDTSLRLPRRSPALRRTPARARQIGVTSASLVTVSERRKPTASSPSSARDADWHSDRQRQRAWSLANGTRGGANSFTAKATDAAGNTGVASAIFVATRDTVAPTDITLSGNTVAENVANGTGVGRRRESIRVPVGTHLRTADNAGGRFCHQCDDRRDHGRQRTLLDYESATSHAVTVRVTDRAG